MEACRKMDDSQETFVVRVNRRENGAWQGNIVWIGERCEQQFRNMQELIALMDNTFQKQRDE